MPQRILRDHLEYAITHWGVGLVLTSIFSVSLWCGASIISTALDRNTKAFDRNTIQVQAVAEAMREQNKITTKVGEIFERASIGIAESTAQSKRNGDLLASNRQILLKLEEERRINERLRKEAGPGVDGDGMPTGSQRTIQDLSGTGSN